MRHRPAGKKQQNVIRANILVCITIFFEPIPISLICLGLKSSLARRVLLQLTAEQTYLQASIQVVQAQAARLTDTAALFQALGGGWWNRGEPSADKTLDVGSSDAATVARAIRVSADGSRVGSRRGSGFE